ncbi:MAG TPA: hypothetical protein VHT34_02465, partial [Clostridia bacterium]|nr:hypothetical protein [Clostridia bacterium]
ALCKSIGFSANTYYKYRSRELADARIRFPALVALDFFIDNKHMDKDSLALKMVCVGIPITGKEAGNLRWQALSYIKRHGLFKNPAVYEFLNADDAWCMDFMQFYDDEDRVKYHLKIIDDRSRMDVANAVLERATTE